MWTPLAKRQIATQCADASHRKLFSQRHQQWPIAISTCTVSEDQESNALIRAMQKSPDRRLIRCSVDKRFWARNGHTYRWRTWASM